MASRPDVSAILIETTHGNQNAGRIPLFLRDATA
jgi:hypothetical protein